MEDSYTKREFAVGSAILRFNPIRLNQNSQHIKKKHSSLKLGLRSRSKCTLKSHSVNVLL